jgi:hypothetical protein
LAPKQQDESALKQQDESAPKQQDESAPKQQDESAPKAGVGAEAAGQVGTGVGAEAAGRVGAERLRQSSRTSRHLGAMAKNSTINL